MIRKRIGKGFLSILLAAGIVATSLAPATTAEAAAVNDYGIQSNIKDGNILHCFDWTYQQIIEELPNIAAAGFTSIQTSPAQAAHTENSIWYYLYQPAGFYVGDAGLGNENDLKRLCSEADRYGIKIIVDVVANHLAGDHNHIDGSLKDSQYWHNLGEGINYYNRYEITHKDIGMADLNSEHSTVQDKVRNYVQQLKSDGVDGIRWDAAKHISLPSEDCNFWRAVIDPSMYNYGEILDAPVLGNSSLANSLMSEYTDYMSVCDSYYSSEVMGAFKDGTVPTNYASWANVAGVEDNELVYFGETHDTYSNNYDNEGGWTKYIPQNKVDRAYAVVASKANSSALYFSRPSATEKTAIKIGAKGSTSFKNPEIAAVNKLHNQCVGEGEYYSTTNNIAVVERKTGATVVLGSGSNQNVTVANGGSYLEPGTYKDQVSGSTFEVTESTISGFVGLSGIAVLLKEDDPNPPTPPTDNITLYFSNNYNWSDVYAYAWGGSAESTTWPGTKMTYVTTNQYNESVYSITVPEDITGIIFSDGNGTQTVDIKSGLKNNTGFYISGNSGNKLSVGTYTYK